MTGGRGTGEQRGARGRREDRTCCRGSRSAAGAGRPATKRPPPTRLEHWSPKPALAGIKPNGWQRCRRRQDHRHNRRSRTGPILRWNRGPPKYRRKTAAAAAAPSSSQLPAVVADVAAGSPETASKMQEEKESTQHQQQSREEA